MDNFPCRVSADLRAHEKSQERAERREAEKADWVIDRIAELAEDPIALGVLINDGLTDHDLLLAKLTQVLKAHGDNLAPAVFDLRNYLEQQFQAMAEAEFDLL